MKRKLLYTTSTITVIIVSVLLASNDTRLRNIENDEKSSIVELGDDAEGPESFAFDKHGNGPYASISDGRILKWQLNQSSWIHFASTSTHSLREYCKGRHVSNRYQMEAICGRPLGVCFNESNGDMYIADAYMGLLVVRPDGGVANRILTHAEGIPFMFTNALDIDHSNGAVYFTDSSSRYQRRDYIYVILSGDKSGRLVRYDPKNKQVWVLLRNLSFPNGVALSKDGNFILVAETNNCRILKYWIKTSKAGRLEVFAELPGFPDNIKRSPRGGYWVGVNSKREKFLEWVLSYPWIGNALIKLPLDLMKVYAILSKYRGSGMALRLGENGQILEVFEDQNKFKSISEVMERDGKLWIGSINFPFAGKYEVTT